MVVYDGSPVKALAGLMHARSRATIGFDPASLSYAEVLSLRNKLRGIASFKPAKSSFSRLRTCKSPAEVEIIRKAVSMSQKAFQEALRGYTGEMRESDFALNLDTAARRMGADDRSFETIVACGPRGAMAHAAPSAKKLKGVTVVDWGVICQGYCSDTTRTVAFGRVPRELRKAHEVVLEAQALALQRIAPGVEAREVDRAARDLIAAAGYGDEFGHGLGHGVGLEVHEGPSLSTSSTDVLEEGMVITVEPGIYLAGIGGVRVEDMVLVTGTGAELLTSLPRGLDPSDYL